MPANIINLEDLVPGISGKTFQLPAGVDEKGDQKYDSYHVPGDLDTDTVFAFLKLFEDMVGFQKRARELQAEAGDDPKKNEDAIGEVLNALKELNDAVKEKLLAVFQIANPSLDRLPFGATTTMVVLGEILEMMGIAQPDLPLPPEGGANPPPANRAARRARTSRKTTSSSTRTAAAPRTRKPAK